MTALIYRTKGMPLKGHLYAFISHGTLKAKFVEISMYAQLKARN